MPRQVHHIESPESVGERLAGALPDRLTRHGYILEIIGDSYRLKSSLQKGKDKPQ